MEFAALNTKANSTYHSTSTILVKWKPPRSGAMKLSNTDSAAPHTPRPRGYGGIFRDHNCQWVMGFSISVTSLEVELKAITCGLELAIQHDISNIEIESDAQIALEYLLTSTPLYNNLICRCKYLLSKRKTWVLFHVFREQNRTADYMAREGARLEIFGNLKVFMSPLDFVHNLLHLDFVGTEYPKNLASNDSYADRDVAYGQFDNVLYNYKDWKLLPLGSTDYQQLPGG